MRKKTWMHGKLHPNFDIKLWNNNNVNKVQFNDIENINLFKSLTDPRALSDIIRLHVLHQYGGVYIDMDINPIRNIEPLMYKKKKEDNEDVFISAFAFLESPDIVNNAILGSTRSNIFFGRLIRDLPKWAVLNHGREAWEITGPKYLTHAVRSFRSEIKVYSSSFFNSIHFSMIKHLNF